MATIKRNTVSAETATDQLMKAAATEHTGMDSLGRVIGVRKPGLLATYQLVEAVGPGAAENPQFMRMALPLIYVCSIDGVPVPTIRERMHVDALINRLGEEGFVAVGKLLEEHFAAPEDKDAQIQAVKS